MGDRCPQRTVWIQHSVDDREGLVAERGRIRRSGDQDPLLDLPVRFTPEWKLPGQKGEDNYAERPNVDLGTTVGGAPANLWCRVV